MKLVETKLAQYIGMLASDAPAPGGGAASAFAAAQGAALCAMVAALTAGRKKYEMYRELNESVFTRAANLSEALCAEADADAEAFGHLSAAYKLPKETDADKAVRAAAIAGATVAATEAPLRTMRLSIEAMELTAAILGKSNTSVVSDLGVAALQLDAGIRGAWLSIAVNLPAIADAEMAGRFKKEGEALVKRSAVLCGKIYGEASASL